MTRIRYGFAVVARYARCAHRTAATAINRLSIPTGLAAFATRLRYVPEGQRRTLRKGKGGI